MAITFTVCSSLLVAIGIGMTAWLYPHPVAFAPYVLLSFAIIVARHTAARGVILAITLASVCVGFWFFWDATFVHLSTLNLIPFEIAVVESLVAGATWLVVHRIERVTRESNTY